LAAMTPRLKRLGLLAFEVCWLIGILAITTVLSANGMRRMLGLAIAIPSLSLWALARYQLGDAFTGRAEARVLVTHGLYSRIRNPIYLFGQLLLLGIVLLLGWWQLFGIFALVIPLQ